MKKFNLKKVIHSMFQQKFMTFPLVLLAISIIWLGYMDMPLNTLPILFLLFGVGWWARSNMD